MSSHIEVRKEIVRYLEQDLIGPHTDDEVLDEAPLVHYLTGILYPSDSEIDAEADDQRGETGDGDNGAAEAPVAAGESMKPSSIGLTCEVDRGKVQHVLAEVTFARYRPDADRKKWTRLPYAPVPVNINLDAPSGNKDLGDSVELVWRARQKAGEPVVLTVFLVNRARYNKSKKGEREDEFSVFQPEIRLASIDGRACFLARRVTADTMQDEDQERFALLYRRKPVFAVGHGCAAKWPLEQQHQADWVKTVTMPVYELPLVEHFEPKEKEGLEMNRLANAKSAAEVAALLNGPLKEYEQWITDRRGEIAGLPGRHRPVATENLSLCEEALSRMRKGLAILEEDKNVFDAFRFANHAMLLQRSYGEWADKRQQGAVVGPKPVLAGKWRLFQIAFLLLNIEGVARPDSDDRRRVDLLWFATGGGKTEAYLLLAAYTMTLRRLRAGGNIEDYAGVTVMMRYTLRLLTVDQFRRATALICACEVLRRQDAAKWGTQPFLIGLWVGVDSTPTTIAQAEEALAKLKSGQAVEEANPVQIQICPWCGTTIEPEHYSIDRSHDWLLIHCPNPGCDFHGKPGHADTALPALTVDEDIYHRCPAFVIGTVDKMARLPWSAKISALFGRVNRYCPAHGFLNCTEQHANSHPQAGVKVKAIDGLNPPELIIQDELHLISGPLGTMVGLYETAVDYLCTRSLSGGLTYGPKIIASTATIRRAREQARSLYARDVVQFPPSGIDAANNFFAREVDLVEKPGRLYVGVCAPSRSSSTTRVRVYANLLQAAQERILTGDDPKVADAYWTLAAYFNSMRELGGTLRLIEDDIPERIKFLARGDEKRVRPLQWNVELTSREKSGRIPEILAALKQPVDAGQAVDTVLATNMISVGVDVPRLGLMVVNGQPKSTSEFIQATSRVGRRDPGLVVTIYNWSRPRDLSHYESFTGYHSTLYRHVEATSVTPFAPRARDRGLRAVFIGLLRALDSTLSANKGAVQFARTRAAVDEVVAAIEARIKGIQETSELPNLQDELAEILDWWDKQKGKHSDLRYTVDPFEIFTEDSHVLLRHAGQEHEDAWTAPDSLREVEPESRFFYSKAK